MSLAAQKELTSNSSGKQRLSQKSTQNNAKMQYFNEVTTKSGILLRYDEEPNILTQEQPLVIRDLEKIISGDEEDENVTSFMEGLTILLKKKSNFYKALLPTNVRKNLTESSSIQQESFLHILLQVNVLQKGVMDIILEEISTQASEETDDTSFLPLLLKVIKRLSIVKDPEVLTEKLLDVLEISTFVSQDEILNAIPAIIPESQYNNTAIQLGRLLEQNGDLTASIINCLNLLKLSNEIRGDIQDRVLQRLSGGSSINAYPILFEFLINDCRQQNLPGILVKCRDALDNILSQESTDKEVQSQKIIIINNLHSTITSSNVTTSKNLFEAFINLLSNVRLFNSEYKPVDLLLLFILHTTASNNKHRVEGLFKKLVKTNMLKLVHLENLFQKYLSSQIISDYLNSIVEVSVIVLKDTSPQAIDFSSTIYKLLFKSSHVDRIQRQDILHNLLLFTGSVDLKNITQVLNILIDLSKDSTLRQHTPQLMSLLNKLSVYDLSNVKQIFDLLSSLICLNIENDNLKDELHMRVRKLVRSSEIGLKRRGIIAAVVMAKHVATVFEEQSEDMSLEDSITINDLPRGGAQEAARLLELAGAPCGYSVELLGLYYDQLANTIVGSENLDKYFVKWLFDTITKDFQNKYVVDAVPNAINYITFETKYSLNTIDEVDTDIYVNIGELSMKSGYKQQSSIAILAPFFRLLRLLHFQQNNGDLSTIDALLGCGVILPNTDDFGVYDTTQIKQISDALFHCANWFRETISAFVTQQQKRIRRKVLRRLEHLVEIESLLAKAMQEIPDHKLPSSYFYNSQQKHKGSPAKSASETRRPPRKKAKINDDLATMSETIASTSAVAANAKRSKKQVVRVFEFRELDTDVMILLKYPLKLEDTLEKMTQATQLTTVSLKCFEFLLKDLTEKLHSLTKTKNLNMSNLSGVTSITLITDCIRLLPNIYNKFALITTQIKRLLSDCDHIYDHVTLFTEEATNLKTTFSLVLECLSLIFNWTGFQNPKNVNLLRDCLKAVRSGDSPSQLNSANQLSKEFANKIAELTDECLYLQPAVHLIQIMKALYAINISNIEIKKKIAMTSAKLLSRPWYNLNGSSDTGKDMFANVDILTQAYLDGANVKTLGGLVGTLQNQAGSLRTKEDRLEMLASIDKASFYVLYRNLCIYLMDRIKIEVTSLTNNEHLILWRTVAVTLQGLMTILKIHETRSNLIHFLKKSIGILKIFLSHGIPILEITLKSKTDQVVEILKTMQTTTRFLHHLCCQSKTTKDTALVAHIPKFRLTVETFIFRVKAALIENDCSAAFWLGNLRNKTLSGEPIPSQSSVASDESVRGEEDEELPPDDEESDEDGPQISSNEGTASEIFD